MSARWRHLVADQIQSSNSATFRERLPIAGALHALLLKVNCTNGATSGRNVSILDVIDEIRVISAKQNPLFLLSSQEIEKWFETLYGSELVHEQNAGAGAVQEMVFPIYFGEGVYDPEIFLPLDKFKSVDLEIDFSPSIAADGGFATGTVTIDVMALMTPHTVPMNYKGTFVLRRLEEFTSGISGDVKVELPDNAIVRNIGIYAYEAGIADNVDITRVQMKDAADGTQLFDADWDDLIHLNYSWFGSIVEHRFVDLCLDNDALNTRIAQILEYSLQPTTAPDNTNDVFTVAVIDAIAGDQVTYAMSTATIVAGSEVLAALAADQTFYLNVKGKAPSYFGVIPYQYPDEVSGYLDVSSHGGIDVILTQGAAGATVRVAIQELMVFNALA